MATKKSKRAKVRAYVFSLDNVICLTVVARSKNEAIERWQEEGDDIEVVEPTVVPVRFAY